MEAAARKAQDAMAEHERLPMPFERARTQLLVGQLQRRQRQKERSRATLREALQAFEAMGTQLWADRARAELARAEVVPTRDLALTPSERRVAELAASGMTNRDVAAALFISPKTVESNLARIYRKLGINSRAELGRLVGEFYSADETQLAELGLTEVDQSSPASVGTWPDPYPGPPMRWSTTSFGAVRLPIDSKPRKSSLNVATVWCCCDIERLLAMERTLLCSISHGSLN